jgi:hypothetical protein
MLSVLDCLPLLCQWPHQRSQKETGFLLLMMLNVSQYIHHVHLSVYPCGSVKLPYSLINCYALITWNRTLTYLLTPWSRVLLQKLTGSQIVKKYPIFYGRWRFITPFTSARHLSLSWARSIQSMSPHPTSQRSNFNLILPSMPGSSNWSLSLRFPH